ncbi:hypothetical protein B0H11DRAFT_2205856 [Mycena galericulata]|nr:hypothetical protein B0H11DRAFT_2205856 [Mycena galericulata]
MTILSSLPTSQPLPVKKGETPPPPSYHCQSCNGESDEEEDDEDDVGSTSSILPTNLPSKILNKSPADFINELNITGRIFAKARGKELIVAIFNPRTGKNASHCYWIPTSWYKQIVSQPPVRRGKKSMAFLIPDEFIDGPGTGRKISIQAAFIRPEYTFIFSDHNVMITFHLMQLAPSFFPVHLAPGSAVWPALWSHTHGPVYSQEPQATLEALSSWRAEVLRHPFDSTPIFASVKATQTVFNGFGAQEATDLLCLALIHPVMRSVDVCGHEEVWSRFVSAIIDYDKSRMDLALPSSSLPFVSGDSPFRMNTDGHNRYLYHISCYRRSHVILDAARLEAAHKLGLFLPNAIIQPNGIARVPSNSPETEPTVKTQLRADRRQATVKIPNFVVTILGGKKSLVTYSPFTARPGLNWRTSQRSTVGSDVRDDSNKTTLGLYSFRTFVDCAWSAKYVGTGGVPTGRRPLVSVGQSNRKWPLADAIARTAAPKKRRVAIQDEENVDPTEGRRTRSAPIPLLANQTRCKQKVEQPVAATGWLENPKIFMEALNVYVVKSELPMKLKCYCVVDPEELLLANQTRCKQKVKQPVAATGWLENPKIFMEALSVYVVKSELPMKLKCHCVVDPEELLLANQTRCKQKVKQPVAATGWLENPKIFMEALSVYAVNSKLPMKSKCHCAADTEELLLANQTRCKQKVEQPAAATGWLENPKIFMEALTDTEELLLANQTWCKQIPTPQNV